MWPFERRAASLELRDGGDNDSYTDALVDLLTRQATGASTAVPSATAALEACAGFVGRSFALAEVTAPDNLRQALTPSCMRLIGRSLVRQGELVLVIRVVNGAVRLLPAQSVTVTGGVDPESWEYRVTLPGPSRTYTHERLPAEQVVHCTYAVEPRRPWRGLGPLQVAALAGRLSAGTVGALADEAENAPRGKLISTPVDGEDPSVQALKADLAILAGRGALVQGGDWDNAGGGRMMSWGVTRLGADPPVGLVKVSEVATREVYASCGLNPALFQSEGETAARESYRQALFSVIAPLGKLVAEELSAKLDDDVTLDWTELRAADIASRARAFQSLVGSGMDVGKAAAITGVLSPE